MAALVQITIGVLVAAKYRLQQQ
ncbi:hypothetical protein CCACVL1_03106 [Corchorus capsularis]|uniref:Uncharacterized protein n=1 Tax=Corchorus capsularis TaxID=210143 RepID=A0A1R3K2Q6_COCAP|nr:hypothetical protein CCACVL1_03106 [Corchorus capsularis]